jgi:hypothetical protein
MQAPRDTTATWQVEHLGLLPPLRLPPLLMPPLLLPPLLMPPLLLPPLLMLLLLLLLLLLGSVSDECPIRACPCALPGQCFAAGTLLPLFCQPHLA